MNDEMVKRENVALELSREAWAKHLAGWRRSGWSMARYCREHGLVLHRFSYRVHAGEAASSGGFVEVRSVDAAASDLTLEWGARAKIRIPRGFDAVTLSRVLELTR